MYIAKPPEFQCNWKNKRLKRSTGYVVCFLFSFGMTIYRKNQGFL